MGKYGMEAEFPLSKQLGFLIADVLKGSIDAGQLKEFGEELDDLCAKSDALVKANDLIRRVAISASVSRREKFIGLSVEMDEELRIAAAKIAKELQNG